MFGCCVDDAFVGKGRVQACWMTAGSSAQNFLSPLKMAAKEGISSCDQMMFSLGRRGGTWDASLGGDDDDGNEEVL